MNLQLQKAVLSYEEKYIFPLRNGGFSEPTSANSSLFSLIAALSFNFHARIVSRHGTLICVSVWPFCPMPGVFQSVLGSDFDFVFTFFL